MTDFTFTSPEGKSYTVSGPEGATSEQAFGILQKQIAPQAPQSGGAMDFLKSIPHGLMSGASKVLSAAGKGAAGEQGFADEIPSPEATQQILEKNVTGQTHVPEGRLGQLGASVGEGLANPLTYLGPGGLPLKVGGSILSSLGGEGARQAAEGTPYEIPAQLAGNLAGGAGAVKYMGARPLAAAIPKAPELGASKNVRYQAARNADLVLDPAGPASQAAQWEQELTNGPKYAFTGGSNGTASKTLEALAEQQAVPAVGAGERATVTGANLDTLRIRLGNIARETHEFKPTSDARAAMVAKQRLAEYTENIPQDHVLGGDAKAYGSQTKAANAENAAFERVRSYDQKITNATDASEGSIAAKIDNQIKSKLRNGYLTNQKKQRGLTQDEVAAIRQTNKGSRTERFLQQFGRMAPEGPMNLALHIGTLGAGAALTGGASIAPQIALALAASAAKHTAQHMVESNANKVAEMLAMRSPLYKERAALTGLYNQLNPTKGKNQAALVRALLAH